MSLPIFDQPFSFRLLSKLTRMIPPFPHASGVSNRIVKPLFCRWHRGERYRVEVWKGIEMILDPADSVAGNLAFVPQLYDRWERAAVDKFLPPGGIFVDAGANVGAYSLWAAKRVGRGGRVLAYEAEPSNFSTLAENTRINGFEDIITARHVGIADVAGMLALQLNDGGNSGGHSFLGGVQRVDDGSIRVACEPLSTLLDQSGVDRVDFMKLDIEGFEQRVLARFFAEVPAGSSIRPRVILTEMYFGDERDRPLLSTIEAAGYRLFEREGLNYLFLCPTGA